MNKKKTMIIATFIIMAFIIIVLTATCIYMIVQKNKKDTEIVEVITATEQSISSEESENDFLEMDLSLKLSNSWESEGSFGSQYEGVITNRGSEETNSWEVSIVVPNDAKLSDSWNGAYSVDGTNLTIKSVEYNANIIPGQNIEFGFILMTNAPCNLEDYALKVSGKEVALHKEQDSKTEATTEEVTEETKKEKTIEKGTPVGTHGRLSVKGVDLVDEKGAKYQLKGISTHGINWFPDYVNDEAFASWKGFGANVIRLAMYTADYNGYCSGGSQEQLKGLIDKGVEAATNQGMYVIIDWHILNDNNPNQNKEEAKKFFKEMSGKYKDYTNVLYEICNEPNGGTTWEDVKSYAEEIIPIIRENDKKGIILIGTPTWSQDVDLAAKNPVKGENLMYVAHFYASTHKDNIRSKVKTAIDSGLPVFISEFSICEASGDGSLDYGEAEEWMKLIRKYNLSYIGWNLSNKNEASSLLTSDNAKISGFQEGDLSESGKWLKEQLEK